MQSVCLALLVVTLAWAEELDLAINGKAYKCYPLGQETNFAGDNALPSAFEVHHFPSLLHL